ncbi:hypothetical protein SEA_KOZIE_69 [Microbacterium phage Kozie]|uniref:DUF2335 domain-containing protein n=1 Tax=Microbacterium phage Kozie TaxID=2885981 RepID=A0AAE8Y7T2_9CAUD|nr:hypothetical protein QC998_gp69 [Microbacterium phage Kozie]UDL16265.1 hypothetical protein SEA_KOZIE_69 [Microbacterium phage Kozie]
MTDEQCLSELEPGLRCDREAGHDGPHYVEGRMPSFVGPMLDQALSDYEAAAENYRRAARRARLATIGYAVGLVAWIVVILANLVAAIFSDDRSWIIGGAVGVLLGALGVFVAHSIHVRIQIRKVTR